MKELKSNSIKLSVVAFSTLIHTIKVPFFIITSHLSEENKTYLLPN